MYFLLIYDNNYFLKLHHSNVVICHQALCGELDTGPRGREQLYNLLCCCGQANCKLPSCKLHDITRLYMIVLVYTCH